jgi:hypothetical protein
MSYKHGEIDFSMRKQFRKRYHNEIDYLDVLEQWKHFINCNILPFKSHYMETIILYTYTILLIISCRRQTQIHY